MSDSKPSAGANLLAWRRTLGWVLVVCCGAFAWHVTQFPTYWDARLKQLSVALAGTGRLEQIALNRQQEALAMQLQVSARRPARAD